MTPPMPDSIAALRATSDALLTDLDVLATLEEQKREIAADDPRLVEVASRIEEIAHRVLGLTVRQRKLTEVVNTEAQDPGTAAPTIEETPRSVASVITEWRTAERRLSEAASGSVDAAEAEALVARLREEYRRAWESAKDR